MHSSLINQRLTFLCTIILFGVLPTMAQYDLRDFVRFSVKDGLVNNYVNYIQQDDLGYIWIGTEMGISRYDGHQFKNFDHEKPSPKIGGGTIRNIKKMGIHRLGIISRYGFQLLNTKDLSVKNYIIPDSTPLFVTRNSISDALQLKDRSIAISTATGFYLLDPSGKLILRHDAYQAADIGKKRIYYGRDIFEISDGNLAVYNEEDQLAGFDAIKKKYIPSVIEKKDWSIFYPPKISSPERWAKKFQLGKNEFVFFYYHKDSVIYYNHRLKKKVASPLPFHPDKEINWESNLTLLSDSSFAVNSYASGFYIFHLDRKSGKLECEKAKYLSTHKINHVFIDRDKRLWAATTNGLLQQKLNKPFVKTFHYPPPAFDNPYRGFQHAYRHKDKLYLARFSRYNGLVILDTSTMQIERRISFYGKDNMWNEISNIQMYHPDTLWLGTNAGILWFCTKTHKYGKVLEAENHAYLKNKNAILSPLNKDGFAWLCFLLDGIIARYHPVTRNFTFYTGQTTPALPFNKVKKIVYDSYGDVWISGHSLARWNNKTQLFDTLITVYGGDKKYNDDILTISADARGSLWLHNADNSLLEYKIKEKIFIQYTHKDGLPSPVIHNLSPVVDDILWIGSPHNLTKLNTITKKIEVFDYTDGLPEESPTGRSIYYDEGGNHYYMFSNNKLVKFSNEQINKNIPNNALLIQEMVINNYQSVIHPSPNIHLTSKQNNISFHYNLVDFENENYEYAYKVNDAESWSNLGQQRNLTLTSLPPGKYLIQLMATGKSGSQKINELAFYIKPPFWQTRLFYFLSALLFISMLYYLYRLRIRQIRQKANIDKQLVQAEMKALHAQMNPHFISNSLNSIREMILNNENKDASHYLTKFAHLIRITLEHSSQSFISLRNTIDYLRRYVEVEQIRNADFTCNIHAANNLDLDEIVLPPMLIQPFIENAIWHSATNISKEIFINIHFEKEGDQLVCKIDDNGMGINQSIAHKTEAVNLHQSFGISNISNRINLLNEKYKLKSSISIMDKSTLPGQHSSGTLVILKLPLEITEA